MKVHGLSHLALCKFNILHKSYRWPRVKNIFRVERWDLKLK